jgi:iron-sulfur cluster assembly protein
MIYMETTINAPVSFTVSAINEIKRLTSRADFDPEKQLRIGVKGGGCSGMTYILEFDTQKGNDERYDLEGVSFIIDKAHSIYLVGMQVDWQGGLNSRGFTFNNPNASSTCGCGTSFAV